MSLSVLVDFEGSGVWRNAFALYIYLCVLDGLWIVLNSRYGIYTSVIEASSTELRIIFFLSQFYNGCLAILIGASTFSSYESAAVFGVLLSTIVYGAFNLSISSFSTNWFKKDIGMLRPFLDVSWGVALLLGACISQKAMGV